jgi:hypothetical protein
MLLAWDVDARPYTFTLRTSKVPGCGGWKTRWSFVRPENAKPPWSLIKLPVAGIGIRNNRKAELGHRSLYNKKQAITASVLMVVPDT